MRLFRAKLLGIPGHGVLTSILHERSHCTHPQHNIYALYSSQALSSRQPFISYRNVAIQSETRNTTTTYPGAPCWGQTPRRRRSSRRGLRSGRTSWLRKMFGASKSEVWGKRGGDVWRRPTTRSRLLRVALRSNWYCGDVC